jgi:hypothetical protein
MAKSNTSKTAAKSTKNVKSTQRPMAVSVELSSEDAAIASLLAELSGEPADEITLATETDVEILDVRAGEITAADVAAAIASAEATDEMIAAAAPNLADGTVSGEESDVVVEAAAAPAEEKPKKERTPRVHYSNKADRIAARLGDKLSEYTVLTVQDVEGALDDDALALKMAETMTLIRGMSQKKQNRAGFLMEFVSGKASKLNEVMSRTLSVLHKDGVLTTGKDGNLLTNLLARPYSPAAARAMGGNTVAVFEDLKLIVADGKGSYRANPESLLLAKANALLGLSTAA